MNTQSAIRGGNMAAFINMPDGGKIRIVNEDGTDVDFEYPKTDLYDKWDRLYPPTRYGKPCSTVLGYMEDGAPIMNYGCVLCHNEKCRHSDSWVVPEEDRDAWEASKQAIREYDKMHNPTSAKLLEEYKENKA